MLPGGASSQNFDNVIRKVSRLQSKVQNTKTGDNSPACCWGQREQPKEGQPIWPSSQKQTRPSSGAVVGAIGTWVSLSSAAPICQSERGRAYIAHRLPASRPQVAPRAGHSDPFPARPLPASAPFFAPVPLCLWPGLSLVGTAGASSQESQPIHTTIPISRAALHCSFPSCTECKPPAH